MGQQYPPTSSRLAQDNLHVREQSIRFVVNAPPPNNLRADLSGLRLNFRIVIQFFLEADVAAW